MIFDQQNLFSAGQAITTAGTLVSTNVIDLNATGTIPWLGGSPIDDPGRGEPIDTLIQVVTTLAGGTSVQAQLVTADDAAISSNVTILCETAAIPAASLVAGYQFRIGTIPPGVSQRYMAVRYVSLGTFASGAVTAGLVLDRQTNVPSL